MASRAFSFDHSEEHAPSTNQQERLQYTTMDQPYHDSPSRDVISPPPPQYASPESPDSPIPTSPVPALYRDPSIRHSASFREESRRSYRDESPTPPPPPPHRSSPTRSAHRNSVDRRPVVAMPAGVERGETGRDSSRRASQDTRSQGSGPDSERSVQQPHPQRVYGADQFPPTRLYAQRPPSRHMENTSYSSTLPFAGAAATPGSITPVSTPDFRSSRYSGFSIPLEEYSTPTHYPMAGKHNDSPYHSSSHGFDATISDASINPYNIADDGDDGFMPDPKRRSAMPMHRSGGKGARTSSKAVGGVAATGAAVTGGFLGRKPKNQTASGSYDPVEGNTVVEKGWLDEQNKGNKKMRLLVGVAIAAVIIIAIVAGVVGGVLGTSSSKANTGTGSTNNANDDTTQNGDLDLNSAEIKKLMNNANLHKVFPGVDYTPWGVQHPLCLTYPPSQNNVTRDMAVLSQLTNTVRLYGTDCNQTEMVLHAIDKLKLTNMKIWLGVWVDTNQTTIDRGVNHLYQILEDVKDHSIFKGAIIGNEALYRAGEDKAQSKQELITLLTQVKSNFTSLGYDLPIATSDLGDNWTADLVAVSDYVMSNIHPFFAGVSAEIAAGWTWDFWQQKDVPLTVNSNVKQIIAETGWPSGGGTDCGGATGACTAGQAGAVASIANMNIFMENWVCQAMANGTDYFWFEAFDEPWKVRYNTPDMAWEDKWGLMDSARVLKPGIKIPSCGGKTVS